MKRLAILAVACWLGSEASVQGHFLFIRILPTMEGGRRAEVYFSEYAEAGDPRFVDKIAGAQLWVQTTPGEFTPLKVDKLDDRLRALVPASGSMMVVGSCTYGVLQRKTPFLLRHFPKAVAGDPEQLNNLKPFGKAPLEIVARIEKDGVQLTALHEGKPLAGATFDTVAKDLSGQKLKAAADGGVFWKPPRPGRYAVYTSVFTKKSGNLGGQKYEEVRDFATLWFTWPLQASQADAEAVALFQQAVKTRASWQGFPGFQANIKGNLDGRPFKGSVTVDAKGKVETILDDDTAQTWVEDQLASIAMHRGAGGPSSPSKMIFRFGDDDAEHPLGRLILVEGGRFASSYRVKDKQILVVNRHLGKSIMTILVLENEQNKERHFLPRAYTVQFWDAADGRLLQTDTVQERWQRLGQWDLPTYHLVTSSTPGGVSVRSFTLAELKLE